MQLFFWVVLLQFVLLHIDVNHVKGVVRY